MIDFLIKVTFFPFENFRKSGTIGRGKGGIWRCRKGEISRRNWKKQNAWQKTHYSRNWDQKRRRGKQRGEKIQWRSHAGLNLSSKNTVCGWYIDSLKISNLVLVKISEFWIHVCVKKKKESVQKKFPFFSLSVIQNQYSGLKTHKILLLPQFQSFFLVSHEEKCNWSSK